MILGLFLAPVVLGQAGAEEGRATVSAALNVESLIAGEPAVLAVVIDVKSGFHAQSHKPLDENLIPFTLKIEPNPAIEVYEPVYPPGEVHEYKLLGKMSVYTGRAIAYVPLRVKSNAPAGSIKLTGSADYQICDDQSCYAPDSSPIAIETAIAPAGTSIKPANAELFADYKPVVVPAKEQWSVLTAFGAAMLAGLLFNVMPCVLPVLPLKAVGFYEVSQHRRSRSILLGVVFSLGLISVFTVLSLVVLVFKVVSWGELFSYGWFIWTIVTVLVLLAFGLLGAWDVSLPTGIYTFEPRHDTLGGNFFWGALTAILATPCTAPLLPPVLLWATQHPTYIGVPAIIMVGVGMAIPYLILSATPELARRFPRTGPWSELFKQMMGFLLLAAAAYFGAGRLINGAGFWWVVVAVVAMASFFLIGRTVQLSKSARAMGISSALAVIMLGGTIWWTAKITGLTQPAGASAGVEEAWEPFSDQRFDELRKSGTPVLVKFTANWCATCQYIEGTVFRDPAVWKSLKDRHVVTLKVDLSNSNAPGKSLLLKLNPSGGIPLTAIWPPGQDQPIQIASIYTSSELLQTLESAKLK